MKISVIVTTYNRPDALSLVLDALLTQDELPTEIVVADDGSKEQTKQTILAFQKKASIPIIHAWQADEGFRAARVRNLAVALSQKEFLIFLDGDCVPMPTFITRYQKLAQKNWFCTGSRISFKKSLTQKIIKTQDSIQNWRWYVWLIKRVQGQVKRLLPLLSFPANAKWRYKNAHNWKKLRSCNMACFYQDYLTVNGFDESYVGWGKEDSDFAIRLINANIKRKDARFCVPVMHLWHQENDRSFLDENIQMLEQVLSSNKVEATTGIKQHLNL